MSISVSIIEDDTGVRTILSNWISRTAGFRLVSAYSSVEHAAGKFVQDAPNVALVDINLPGLSGIQCVRRFKSLMPTTQFLMLTVFEDNDHIFDALAAGAAGYLLKRTPKQELLQAIEQVNAGGSPMTSYIARKVVTWFQVQTPGHTREANVLSAREKDILQLLAQGFAYKEMAEALGISMGTINTHVRRIYQKLHVSSRTEAVAALSKLPR